jgi:uncharacterized protein
MPAREMFPVLDRPWRRPGGGRYAATRLRLFLRPPVTVHDPVPGAVLVERDVPVRTRDGTILRVNVHRPPTDEPVPVLMSAHPYGKDKLPRLSGRRAHVSMQYRLMRQTAPVSHSTLTGWEAPDPEWWVQRGYAVVNADLRGAGHSDGIGAVLSDQEGEDVYDLVEWAAAAPWSTGKVGLLGVSYLAMSQYKVAALRPPGLAAICPWEGMTDVYREFARPGGVADDGFFRIWTTGSRRVMHAATDLWREQRRRPLRDDFWQSLVPDLARIEVPMLVCASFSDANVHTKGSFRAFERVGSADRYVYTHRGGKWSTFYGENALAAQRAFFDRYLKGADVAPPARVRLEVREDCDTVVAVREEQEWPLARTAWEPLHLAPGGRLSTAVPTAAGQVTFEATRCAAAFGYRVPADMEITGPMSARLWLEVHDADDVNLVVGVEKWRGGHDVPFEYVPFEGSFGFSRDRVATGWLKASLRELDEEQSATGHPVHTFRRHQPLRPGEVVPVDVELAPSATLFRRGDVIRLVVAGRWLWSRNPLTGQFPAHYRHGPRTRMTLHWSPDRPAHLLVPRIPSGASDG